MSRTFRRYPIGHIHKHPRGYKRATLHNVRRGAIPPNPNEDLPICDEAFLPFNIALRLYENYKSISRIKMTLKNRFGLRPFEIRHVVSEIKHYSTYLERYYQRRKNYIAKMRRNELKLYIWEFDSDSLLALANDIEGARVVIASTFGESPLWPLISTVIYNSTPDIYDEPLAWMNMDITRFKQMMASDDNQKLL